MKEQESKRGKRKKEIWTMKTKGKIGLIKRGNRRKTEKEEGKKSKENTRKGK